MPDHGVGAVILTNGDPGWLIRGGFRRKLLEVLFDGRPEADADLESAATAFARQLAAERKLMTVPAQVDLASGLAAFTSLAREPRPSSTSVSGRARWGRARTRMGRCRS